MQARKHFSNQLKRLKPHCVFSNHMKLKLENLQYVKSKYDSLNSEAIQGFHARE